MAAAQSPDMEGGDLQYISRLIRLARHFVPAAVFDPTRSGYRSGTLCLLAFDKFYEKNGSPDRNKTTMYIPNEYAVQIAVEFPDLFVPFGSVNPYRHDAIQELEKCAQLGVTIIKWLPNSMGIDPSDEQCVPFYMKMNELGMALLVHIGEEHAVNAAYINNRLGNPLLLRRALDCGVKVIGAHCATEGMSADLDNGGVTVSCFSLFLRLMREDKYKGLLFGDISATCGFKRLPYLKQLLQATDIHDRLVYGSDYPVPAINLVVHTSKLLRYSIHHTIFYQAYIVHTVLQPFLTLPLPLLTLPLSSTRQGFITQEEASVLNELYNYNPLLFDFACKRLVRGPSGEKFPPQVFKAHPLLPPFRHESKLLGSPV
ncbi:hypothetical protein GBAR_LOCUS7924 [Geodia barretti]|uniref:2-amino-3-carboxymuconate-6-semialdehyde decarboxylase n=1 Tax=Geodia barretti TaxID=519541 RepID=A0AA35RIW0_GEOBA|nr:hypothetical protein GBAR_LOCUS7924 [Geodia barretti]